MTNVIRRLVLFMLLSVCGAFSALSYAETKPEFSQVTSAKWYYVKFKAGGMYLTGHGQGKGLTVERLTEGNNQKWMLQGDENNFYLSNLDNYQVNIKRGNWDEKKNNCPAVGDTRQKESFKLHVSSHASYSGSYEIESTTFSQKCLNTWGGVGAGTPIGVWYSDDSNNAVEFIPVDGPSLHISGITNYTPTEKNTLWYTLPASNNRSGNAWMEYSLPIGNGQLGASVFGDVKKDEIIFNEKTLWTGTSTSVGTTGWGGNNNEYGAYQVFGAIRIEDQNALGNVTNYLRDLNLANATASMSYTHEGVNYKREYIVSEPDKVVATRLSASANGKININVSLTPKMVKGASAVTYSAGEAHFSGKLDVVTFDARMKVVAEGGKVQTNNQQISVTGANEVLIVLAAGTDFDNSKPDFVFGKENLSATMDNRVKQAAAKKWTALYKAHVDDYKSFYDRVKLNLTGAENTLPTDQLVDAYQRGSVQNTLMLEQLYFNYGRYLEIASSRGVDLPSNLQGIWTNSNKAAWNADIHANINVQMNYWPAEITNMSEMHEPFLNYIIKMAKSEPWIRYAKESNQDRGWTCYTENNIFGGVGVWAHNYVIVNAWYCTHLWQHYRYTLNKDFLTQAFPAMLSATQFWLDRLVLKNGQYLCPKEYSPEHGPEQEDGVAHAQQLVWELFDNTLKAVKVLGEDVIPAKDLADLKEKFSKLDKGLATEDGPNGPLLREWKYSDYTAGQRGHRHLSHLMCLYPLGQINSSSEYFQPAINSLIHRGDPSTGWSMGWKINLWARALDGNHAHKILKMALKHSTSYGTDESQGGIYYNLFDSHAPFQIDGNFGACAGIAEMLFQSYSDVLDFLPALPDAWANGAVNGLKGVGNFTVGVDWKDGLATKITILNNKGQKCLVKCARAAKPINEVAVTVNGRAVSVVATHQPGVFEIPSSGIEDVIVIDFSQESGVSPEPAPDYSGQCGESLNWNLAKESGVLTITGNGAMYDYSAEQPAPWTAIADEITSIAFPEGITHIGAEAFTACTQSMTVYFYQNVITIGANAFSSSIKTILEVNDDDYADVAFPLTENRYNEIVYHRELVDGRWGTVILPFALNTETANLYDFYELSAVKDATLTFKYVRYPLANRPYMYKNSVGIHGTQMISDKSTTIEAHADFIKNAGEWSMLGCFAPLEISGTQELSKTYVLSNGKILNSTRSVKVRPFRAYFNGPDYSTLPSKSFRVVITDEDGEMTDITEVLQDEAPANGPIYDLAGRRVWQTVPGHIYIQKGKKFIAK